MRKRTACGASGSAATKKKKNKSLAAKPSPRRLLSPRSPPSDGNEPFGCRLSFFAASASKKITTAVAGADGTPMISRPSPATPASVVTVSDLREMAASRSDALKRHLEHCHGEVVKEIDASTTRLSKRYKLQTQACMQLMEEVERDYKKMSERITENAESLKAEYEEFIKEAQASASRVCKVSIPELAQSMDKAIDALRSRYRIPATPL